MIYQQRGTIAPLWKVWSACSTRHASVILSLCRYDGFSMRNVDWDSLWCYVQRRVGRSTGMNWKRTSRTSTLCLHYSTSRFTWISLLINFSFLKQRLHQDTCCRTQVVSTCCRHMCLVLATKLSLVFRPSVAGYKGIQKVSTVVLVWHSCHHFSSACVISWSGVDSC